MGRAVIVDRLRSPCGWRGEGIDWGREPGRGVRLPERGCVCTWVEPEQVLDAGRGQRLLQRGVGRNEGRVGGADVEGELGRIACELLRECGDEVLDVRPVVFRGGADGDW